MPATYNPLSAFEISWPSSDDHQQQHLPMAFSSNDNVESPPETEEGLGDAVVNAAIGYEQGTSQSYIADRQRAMRVLTRKGQILDGNPYRLPGIPNGEEKEIPRTKDDFEVVYHLDALAPIQEETNDQPTLTVEAIRPRSLVQEARATAYLDDETLARLEGHELFPQDDDWDYVNDNVPLSWFSPWDSDSDSSPQKTGVFRSFSKKVKGSFRRPARPKISGPLLDLRHEPDNPAGMSTVMGYAVPIENPAPELAVRACNVQEAMNLRHQHANTAATTPSRTRRPEFQAPRPAPPRPQKRVESAKPAKVNVVGHPDRMTQLGDFMDVGSRDSSSEDSYDREREILRVRSLHPLRKPAKGKKVDTLKYSWMPPEPSTSTLPMPLKVTSQNDWHMSAEYPTIDNLFNEIDQQIAGMDISRGTDVHDAQEITPRAVRPAPKTPEVDGGDEEREVMVDTYIQGGHTFWRATERVAENPSRTTERQLGRERTDRSFEEDEAAASTARLERLTNGSSS